MAPCSDHCVEKKSSAEIKICYHPKNRLNKLSWLYLSNVWHMKWWFPFVMVNKGFISRNWVKSSFLGAVQQRCHSSHKNFFLKIFGHGITSAFSFWMTLPKKKEKYMVLVAKEHFALKKIVSWSFYQKILIWKMTFLITF